MGSYSAPLEDLLARLDYHKQPGGILAGFKVFNGPAKQTFGTEDLPAVQVLAPELTEEQRNVAILAARIIVRLQLNTARTLGISGWVAAAEKVMDAVERRAVDGYREPALAGTRTPMRITAGQSIALDLSLGGVITLTVEPKFTTRADRRL